MRPWLWFLAGAGTGIVVTLNGYGYVQTTQTDEKEVVRAMEKARMSLQGVMAEARRHTVNNVVATPPDSWTPCPPCKACAPCKPRSIRNVSSYFIVGLVMHVERTKDYLDGTLHSLAMSELANSRIVTNGDALVMVYDASTSKSFDMARKKYAGHPLFRFERQGTPPKRIKGSASRQARDVASAVRRLIDVVPNFGYALLLEDDWLACRGLLSSVVMALEAGYHAFGSDVSAVRISYGLNGVVVPRPGLPSLATFIDTHAETIPPDHAFTAWALDTGKLITFRHNAFVHVGGVSSIGNAGTRWNTACYELLFDWLHSDTEAFQISKCAHDVISPCLPKHENRNPHPDRRKKDFSCDVALQDFPAYRASRRLMFCLKASLRSGKSPDLLNSFHHS